jgi:hypothetical protein
MKRDTSVPVEFRLAVWTLRRMYGSTYIPTSDEVLNDAVMICTKRNLPAAFVIYAMKQIATADVQ